MSYLFTSLATNSVIRSELTFYVAAYTIIPIGRSITAETVPVRPTLSGDPAGCDNA